MKNSGLLLNDVGGIYVNARLLTGRVVDGNIVDGVLGNNSGTAYPTRRWARGVYIDNSGSGVTVTNNTATQCEFGFMNGGGSNNIWLNNTAYDDSLGGMFIQDYAAIPGSAGVRIEDLTIKYNKFVGKSVSENTMRVYVGSSYIAAAIAVSDSNYIMRPVAEGATVNINTAMNTLAQWRTFSGHDANSTVSPINLSDDSKITFIYNPENKDSTFNVTDKLTIDGDKFSGDSVLTAYSSAIFFVDPAPAPPDPAEVVIDSIYTATRKHMFVYSNATSDGGESITERGVAYSTVGSPTADSTKVTSGTGTGTFSTRIDNMLKLTTYYIRSYAINSVDTAYSDTYIVTTPEYNYLANKAGKLLTDKSGNLIIYDPARDSSDTEKLIAKSAIWLIVDPEYITTDGQDSALQWTDQSPNERHLTASDGTGQAPLFQGDTLLFNGTTNYMYTSNFTQAQPVTIIMSVNQLSYVVNSHLWSGSGAAYCTARLRAGNTIRMSAGLDGPITANRSLGVRDIVFACYNGAESVVYLNQGAGVSRDVGTNILGGLYVGATNTGTLPANISVKAVIVMPYIISETERATIYDYLLGL